MDAANRRCMKKRRVRGRTRSGEGRSYLSSDSQGVPVAMKGNDDVREGENRVVGTGRIAAHHTGNLKRLEAVLFAAMCDVWRRGEPNRLRSTTALRSPTTAACGRGGDRRPLRLRPSFRP